MKFVLCLIFAVVAAAADSPNVCPKSSESVYFFDERCCGNQVFGYDHLQKFIKDCLVPPKDQNLPINDAFWKFFECVVTKSLEPKPLNLENFAELMSSNFSQETKSAILSSLPQPDADGKISITQFKPTSRLDDIKSMWTNYFDAEYKVCSEKFNSTTFDNSGEMLTMVSRESWDPSDICNGTKYPNIGKWNEHVHYSCLSSLSNEYNLKNATTSESDCMSAICLSINLDWTTREELENENFNYESKLAKMMLEFFPKYLVDSALQLWPEGIQTLLHDGHGTTFDTPRGIQSSIDATKNYTNDINEGMKPICTRAMTLNIMSNGFGPVKDMACGHTDRR